MDKDFVALILSFGRPDNVKTLKTLQKYGYKGDFRIVCSDDDKTLDLYKQNFGDKVVVFSKKEIAKTFDTGDNLQDWRTIVFARNACFDIAEKEGFKYFIELDDDYTSFNYRVNSEGRYQTKKTRIKDINIFLNILLRLYKKTNAKAVCMAQAGDFVGGDSCSLFKKGLGRKAMNSHVCSTERRFKFMGRVNEDVNTYVNLGNKGNLFFTACEFALTQEITQSNEGGMSDTYALEGTYIKSFYSVMYNPSSVKVGLMGAKNMRLHHKINWNKSVPKILEEKYKK
tara:strand:- start:156 stop:1007 length:852 start_codon:yes stop_codon:yes gene_type:complete